MPTLTTSSHITQTRPAVTTANRIAESQAYFEALGRRISQLRESRGYTQAECARYLGVSQQALFAYEMGQRRVSIIVLQRMANLYAMSLDQLTGLVPKDDPPKLRISPQSMRLAERIQRMSKTARHFVVRIVDTAEEVGRMRGRRPARVVKGSGDSGQVT